jgi:hypothetical protein
LLSIVHHIPQELPMKRRESGNHSVVGENLRYARRFISRELSPGLWEQLRALSRDCALSLWHGDLLLLNQGWYVTHAGLLRLAKRRHCAGIHVQSIPELCNAENARYAFRATVFTSGRCHGFVGYGDADPANVSPLVHGAELRVAETRAVNRALRKAYGIGVCSVEEIGRLERQQAPERPVRKPPPESTDGNGSTGHGVNGNGSRVRDRLCLLIRQHKLDAELVKAYAVEFCGTKTLREASREQVEKFVAHLADWAAKNRNALLRQLNSYVREKESAA